MRATISVLTDPVMLTSATAVEPTAFTAYNAATAYALGALVSVVADFANYEYLQIYDVAVVGKTPLSSPLYWRRIGPTETAFDPAKIDYALGATVYSAATHHCYESLVLQAAAHPLPVLPETETAYWLDLGMTNKYAALDLDRNTQTVYASPHTWVITPGVRINTIGLTGMKANELVLKVTSVQQGGTVYPLAYDATHTYSKNECMTAGLTTCYKSKADNNIGHAAPNATWWDAVAGAVFDLNTRQVFNATEYYYNPFSTRPTKVVFDVPQMVDAIITVTLTATSGNVKCASIVAGQHIYLGSLLKPASAPRMGISSVDRDAWGHATLVKRPAIPTMKGQVLVPGYRIDSVRAAGEVLDAVPALYSGVDEDGDWTDTMTVLGVHQQFDIETNASADDATLLFEAEGV